MEGTRRITRCATWLRVLRGIVVALGLALVPAPAAASDAVVVDAIELVASFRATAARPNVPSPSQRPAQRAAAGEPTFPAKANTRALPTAKVGRNAPIPRLAPLFLLDCALLR